MPFATTRFETLQDATKRYQLNDSGMSNTGIAQYLGLQNNYGDFKGSPGSCFFSDGYIAAIRTKPGELVVFHLYERIQAKMADIAVRID
ncbi:MAG: hypothetical protein Q8P23_01590 [bacterium]|nr:hypothetical protein [bacterium]